MGSFLSILGVYGKLSENLFFIVLKNIQYLQSIRKFQNIQIIQIVFKNENLYLQQSIF